LNKSTKLSIAVPTYEFNGKGAEILENLFDQLNKQSFKDFDVIVSDDSKDDNIYNFLNESSYSFDIQYYKNVIRGASNNFNNAISKCTGRIIKLICADDYFFDNLSLERTVLSFAESDCWLASAYWHTKNKIDYFNFHLPSINPNIFVMNTIGTPSCIAFRNITTIPKFDSNLTYYYDCEWYYQMIKLYGCPRFLNTPTIVNYLWENSVTAGVTKELEEREISYILNKYKSELENRNEKKDKNNK
jgi:glycosyltransferase involved in cell wall biosynthesis